MSPLDPHPRFLRLKEELKTHCPDNTVSWSKPAFRCVEPRWSRPEYLITGDGTMKNGGRWMRKGIASAVYASASELIALKEAKHNFTRYGIKPRRKPRILIELEVNLHSIVSLRTLFKTLSWPSVTELFKEDWEDVNAQGVESLSQAFGRALFELKYEGFVAPSARDRRGSNLLWFPQNLRPNSRIKISGESELDRWIAK